MLAAYIVVKVGDTKIYLSVRDNALQQLLGPYDPDDVDTNDLEEKLLLLYNVTITYTCSYYMQMAIKSHQSQPLVLQIQL